MERHADDPFAIVGINTDGDPDRYRELAEEHGVTWTNAFQGGTDGPIPTMWGVDSYPTVFVLDGEGRIREVGARGDRLENLVGELVAEARASEPSPGGAPNGGG